MHLDDEQIQRLLHGELRPPLKEVAQRHLGDCAACRRLLAEAEFEEQWVFDLLRQTDQGVPAVQVEAVARQASSRTAMAWARAAAIVLAVAAAGAAYTAPGSPVPGWIDRMADWITGGARREPVSSTTTPTPPMTSGIEVTPGERFTIRFTTAQSAGVVTVSLTDGQNVVARALNGAASFTTDVDRLTIGNDGSIADYEIELPRGAPWVEITVGQQRLLLKQGQTIVTDAPTNAQGHTIIGLAP